MKLIFIFCIIACIRAVNQNKHHRRGVRNYLPKTDHEKELLKQVVDKINRMLKDSEISKPDYVKDDILDSVMSMVLDRDNRQPKIESEARAFETLAHVIADVSEQLKKRQSLDYHPNVPSKSNLDSRLYGNFDLKKPGMGKTVDMGLVNLNLDDTKKELIPERNREADKPILKLTPHLVFTDSDGKEYRLVGAGGRSAQTCNGQCLRVDDSKNVLAYKKPFHGEHLVLVGNSGDEFFTSGVQLCEDLRKGRNTYLPANLALIAPKQKIEPGISIAWSDEKTGDVKRENPLSFKEFSNDVNTLFNGEGLKSSKTQQVGPDAMKKKILRRKKHARLYARRRRNNLHHRETRDLDNDDYYYDDESLVDSVPERTATELKLLEALKKDKKSLEQFARKEKSKVNVDKCKQHCETLSAGFQELSAKETSPIREKRSTISNLSPESDLRPLTDAKSFRIIEINPKGFKSEPLKNEPSLLGEINMVQPESSPDDENQVLLKVTDKPADARHDNTNVEKLDVNGEEEVVDLPELFPSHVTESNEKIFFPDHHYMVHDHELHEPHKEEHYFHYHTPDITPVQDFEEHALKPSSSEIGSQSAEAILYRVQNSKEMKNILGLGLKIRPPEVIEDPVPQHGPHYSSTLQILLKTLMLNVEKIAEEDVQSRSCVTLETELQNFLDEMLNLKSHPNLPSLYNANMVPVVSYATLSLRKNELLDLLREFHNLPAKAQQHASGVKSFIETEISDIDKQINGH